MLCSVASKSTGGHIFTHKTKSSELENLYLGPAVLHVIYYYIHVILNERDIYTEQADISSGQLFAPMRPLIGQLLANQQDTGRKELGAP